MKLLSVITIGLCFKLGNSLSNLPDFIQVCHQSDPDLNECIKRSVERIKPYLKAGIPELDIPPCEPLFIKEIIMKQGRGTVDVKSNYTNINIYGPSDFLLRSIRLDMNKDQVEINLLIPRLYMVGDYSIKGRLLRFPIEGKGVSHGNYSDVEASVIIYGEKVLKDGQVYFNVVNFSVHFTIGNAYWNLTNLFNGDKMLGEAINMLLNENWREVSEDMQPVIEKKIGDIFKTFANKIFHRFPLCVLLPP